jgi:hypothetical protein
MKERIVRRAKGVTVTKDGYGKGRTYRLYSRGCMGVEFETGDAREMKDYMKTVHNIK